MEILDLRGPRGQKSDGNPSILIQPTVGERIRRSELPIGPHFTRIPQITVVAKANSLKLYFENSELIVGN